MKIVTDIRTIKAQQTGVYRGPGGDYRYQKAGSNIVPGYVFSHKPGEHPAQPATAEKKG